jgi:hypothetical protein
MGAVSWSRVICTSVLHSEDLPGWVEKVQKEMATRDLEQKDGDVEEGEDLEKSVVDVVTGSRGGRRGGRRQRKGN